LHSVIFLWKIISSKRRVIRKPNSSREVAVKEEISIIFHYTARGTMFVNMSGIPYCR